MTILYRSERQGDSPQTMEARRIYYNRVTGEARGEGVRETRGQTSPGK